MASGDVFFRAEDLYVSSDEAVCDAFPAVDECATHNDGVLYLRVSDGGVVSDACVGSDVGVGAYLAVLTDHDWSADRGSAVDYCAFADSDVVG